MKREVDPAPKPSVSPAFMLTLAIFAVSLAAIFIRKADAPPLFVAFGRCFVSTVVLLPFTLRPFLREIGSIPKRSRYFALLAGVLLGAHFAAWISSLSYSSVASCVVLANTTPIWAATLTPFLAHQKLESRVRSGIFVSFCGVLIIEGPALLGGGGTWQGDLLALAAGLLAALYLLCGSRARVHFTIGSYLLVCYGAATVVLFGAVLATDTPLTGYSSETLVWVALLGLVSQLIGHSTFNWALRYLSAAVVSLSLLAEPILTALWAWLILSEPPTVAVAIGGGVVLFGVWVATRSPSRD